MQRQGAEISSLVGREPFRSQRAGPQTTSRRCNSKYRGSSLLSWFTISRTAIRERSSNTTTPQRREAHSPIISKTLRISRSPIRTPSPWQSESDWGTKSNPGFLLEYFRTESRVVRPGCKDMGQRPGLTLLVSGAYLSSSDGWKGYTIKQQSSA